MQGLSYWVRVLREDDLISDIEKEMEENQKEAFTKGRLYNSPEGGEQLGEGSDSSARGSQASASPPASPEATPPRQGSPGYEADNEISPR